MYILSIPTEHLDKLKFFQPSFFCQWLLLSPWAAGRGSSRHVQVMSMRWDLFPNAFAERKLQTVFSWFLVRINFWKSMFCVTQNQRVLVKAPQLHLAEEIQCCMPSLWADSLRVIGYFLQVVSVRNHTFLPSIIENGKWRCSNEGTFQIA